jgi:hypothetical protein
MNIVHEEVKDILFGIDLDYVVFDSLDSIILKKMGSSCQHQPNQTSDWYWYETDGIFIDEVNPKEVILLHQGYFECVREAKQHEYFNASYAIQWQQHKPTIIYIDEYRFNNNSIKDLRKWIDDIHLEQIKRKKDQNTPIEELIEDAIKRMDK